MDKIFTLLRIWLAALRTIDCPPDALALMHPDQLADLPPLHPRRDDGCAC